MKKQTKLCKQSFNGAGDVVNLLQASNDQLNRYIGKTCVFKKWEGISYAEAEKSGKCGWGSAGKFKIVGVQKIWGGGLAFRVQSLEFKDGFGKPALVNEIKIID